MADLKISQLNSLAGTSLADTDVLAVVDTSASETKKITSVELVRYGYGLISAGTLDGDIIEAATTSARGTVQLTNSTSSTSTTTAAVPNAVKSAYDLADAALPKAGGTMTGQILADDSSSASTPGYAFDGDGDTGMVRTGANELALVTGGSNRLTIDASGNVTVPGNLTVSGTTTTIDTTNLVVEDKNIEIGAVGTPTDVTADGGGITLKGSTDKTINWVDATDAWTFSEHVNIASAKEYRIAGTKVLDATSLGSAVVSSSLTSVGTLTSLTTSGVVSVPLGTAGAPTVTFTGDTNTGIYSPGADQVAISTNGTGRLFIDASGRVGTGAVNSSSSFGIATNRASLTYGLAVDTFNGASFENTFFVGFNGNVQTLGNFQNFPLTFLTNNTERMRLDSSGRLGLGTSSPNHLLQVNGSACIAGTADNIFFGLDDNTSPRLGLVKKAGGGPFFGAGSSTSFVFSHSSGTDIATPSSQTYSERARIDSSGRLLVGTSSARSNFFGTTLSAVTQTEGTGGAAGRGSLSVINNDVSNNPPYVLLGRSGAATLGSNAAVVSGSRLGTLTFHGADGTNFVEAATVAGEVDGTPGTNDMPGRLVFSTTADGASSPTERMRIAQNGVVTIQNGAVAVIGTLTDGATITPDLAADCNFTVTLGGNRTIANPTNITAGQSGSIFIVQDATGGRTASWGSFWDFPGGTAPTLSTAANAVDRVDYIVRSSTSIHTVFTANYS
jgi:hypothetical protein